MARYRLAFDVESSDPMITKRQLLEAAKAAEEYVKVVLLPDMKVDFIKSAEPNRSVHEHASTRRRACQACIDELASDALN